MYTVYIIKSETTGKYYIGFTSNLEQRLKQHNTGANRSTKDKGSWTVIYTEIYQDKSSAWKREQQIKKYKGGEAFKKLVNKNGEIA